MTKRVVFRLIALAVAGVIATFLFFAFGSPLFKYQFVHKWIGVFRHCNTLDDIAQRPPSLHPEWIYIREFSDGSWLAASSSSPSDNHSDYFANVFRDSRGKIFTADHDFDGYEGLAGELTEVDANSVDEFFRKGTRFHFTEQSTR